MLRSKPANIGEIYYSGHSLDQMQKRELTPSVVPNTIKVGLKFLGKRPGTLIYCDPINNIKVITDSKNGNVITVIPRVMR